MDHNSQMTLERSFLGHGSMGIIAGLALPLRTNYLSTNIVSNKPVKVYCENTSYLILKIWPGTSQGSLEHGLLYCFSK